MEPDDLDDEDWEDIAPLDPGEARPDVAVSLAVWRGRYGFKPGATPRVRAQVTLRREPAEWARAHGPRFRAQIRGGEVDRLRLVADAMGGRFEAAERRGGVIQMSIGVVSVWPNELRAPTEARWRETPGGLVIQLPREFVHAGHGPAPQAVAAPEPPPARAAAFPIITEARGLEAARPRRAVAMPGEPPAGRSALDQRRRGL